METSQLVASVTAMHEEARRRRLFFQTPSDTSLQGRTVTLDGRPVVAFSSCSYLGLELHPAVIAGVHDAVDRYGAQFSCSRGYLSAPIYTEMEGLLERIFGGAVLATPSTTLAHLAALPVLATEKDAIVLDHQGHHSLHMGCNQARAGGAVVELVRHDHLDEAREVVRRLAQRARTVWFVSDGVFSMYGDLAPLDVLQDLLSVAPNVRLYIDDAHGMSWAGRHGRGSFLDRFPLSDRVVVATSFAKGFGAGGGCLVFSDPAERDRVRLSGGPLVFSGPMQPPMMGAVCASARIHLSEEIGTLQAAQAARVDHVNRRLVEAGIAPIARNGSPIFFLLCGLPRVAFRVAERMLEDGVYLNCSVFPTVPMRRAGIRFTVTAAHGFDEIDHALDRLAVHLPATLEEEGVSRRALAEMFHRALPASAVGEEPPTRVGPPAPEGDTSTEGLAPRRLELQVATSIQEVDRATWDAALGREAHCSWEAMATVEGVFGTTDVPPEHRWSFRYLLVRDGGRLVAATFLTTLLQKDDMLSREEVSRELEARRRTDPYLLTSTVVMVGSNLSEGNHLWLDRAGPWREALRLLLHEAHDEMERVRAAMVLVRDLPDGDPELDAFMLEEGLTRVPTLDTHELRLDDGDEAAWYAALPKKKRQQLRPVLEAADEFRVSIHGAGHAPLAPAEVEALHGLYLQLATRKLRLNVFPFPSTLLPALLASPAWEVGVVRFAPGAGPDEAPVAFWAAHLHEGVYAPLICGLERAWVEPRGTYRAMLLGIVRRARALGARRVRLGMDAEIEKRRFGAEAAATCVYAQARDHWAGALLREIAAGVSLPAAELPAAK